MESKELRSQTRVNWRGNVHLIVPGAEPITATIADISEAGCGLQIERAVEIGATAAIQGDVFEAAGVVRYCYPHQGGFRVGVELLPAT